MKRVFTVLSALVFVFASAQDKKEKASEKSIHPDPLIRFYGFYPLAIGDNTLSKAHRENPGIGINASFFSIYNFHIGVGYHYTEYLVTDIALAGNFRRSNYWGIYPFISYEFPVNNRISFWPEGGIGFAKIKQNFSDERVSNQEGTEIRLGVFADYKFTRHFSIYTGANYIHSNMRIAANSEVRDFYGSLNQLQLCLGLQLEVWPNRTKENSKSDAEKSIINP